MLQKKKVFDVLFPHRRLPELMDYLDRGRLLLARSILHEILDDAQPPKEVILDDGERLIYNAKVERYREIRDLYNQLLEQIERESKVDDFSTVKNFTI